MLLGVLVVVILKIMKPARVVEVQVRVGLDDVPNVMEQDCKLKDTGCLITVSRKEEHAAVVMVQGNDNFPKRILIHEWQIL